MNTQDQSLASAAAAYFEARDEARREDKRRRQREKDACPKGDDFTFNGETVFSLAHMETMRPREPMTPAELLETIERLQRGNALLVEEYPAKLSAFEQAMSAAQTHFAARDEARRAAGIPDTADDDDALWLAIEELEISAWSTTVETIGDVAGFLGLLQDHLADMGSFHDHIIQSRLIARLGEAITLLGKPQQ
jgi:hypothetical protein